MYSRGNRFTNNLSRHEDSQLACFFMFTSKVMKCGGQNSTIIIKDNVYTHKTHLHSISNTHNYTVAILELNILKWSKCYKILLQNWADNVAQGFFSICPLFMFLPCHANIQLMCKLNLTLKLNAFCMPLSVANLTSFLKRVVCTRSKQTGRILTSRSYNMQVFYD